MLFELNIPTLKERRRNKRSCSLYSISKGKVPGIPANNYLLPIKNKRKIKAKTFDSCVTQNIIQRHQNLHSYCFQFPDSQTTPYIRTPSFLERYLNGMSYQKSKVFALIFLLFLFATRFLKANQY